MRLLQLQTGRDAINLRRKYYKLFLDGDATLRNLRFHAPLVCRAVENALGNLQPPQSENHSFGEFLVGDINICKLEQEAPEIAAAVREELPPCR